MGLIREHAGFRRLWLATTASEMGSQISLLAVPLIAVVSLRVSTFAAAALVAAGNAAFLVAGLPAGAWVDRMRRRRVMITADLVRALLLASIPVAYATGILGFWWLCAVVLGTGLASVFFDVAYMAYLPSVVGRDALVAGNARLETSRSVAYAGGPALSGVLIRLVSAPVAVIVDAASFCWSAAWLALIPEDRRSRTRIEGGGREAVPLRRPPMTSQIGEGFAVIWRNRILRAIALYNLTVVTFWSLERAIGTVFLVRVVHLSAGSIGLLYSAGSAGAVAGGYVAGKLSGRLGQTRGLLLAATLCNLFVLLVPLTAPGWRLAFYVVGTSVSSCFVVAFNVLSVSYRQRVCPDELLGRMNATMRFVSWGSLPVGSLLGGWIATVAGVRPTLWLGSAGGLLGVLWLVRLAYPSRAPHADSGPEPATAAEVPTGRVAP